MWPLKNICGLLFITMSAAVHASSIKGPPQATRRSVTKVGRQGKDIQLDCPIEGNPTPFIEWYKDNEKIDDIKWIRYRIAKRTLKIRNATVAEDSGRFYCLGINGFGKERTEINLFIIDAAQFPEMTDKQLESIVPPQLTADSLSSRSLYDKFEGETFTVSCSFVGSPRPTVVWYKNGLELLEDRNIETVAGSSGSGSDVIITSQLQLRNLRTFDGGRYECVGANSFGEARREYNLSVADKASLLPEDPVLHASRTNKTVGVGETATFDCRVSSSSPPNINWLKKVEQHELPLTHDAGADKELINLGGDTYRMIVTNGGGSVKSAGRDFPIQNGFHSYGEMLQEEEYLSKLELEHVRKEDEGMYICLVINDMGGISFKNAFLTVITKPDAVLNSPLVLSLTAALSVVALAILTAIVVCVVRHRRSSTAANNNSTAATNKTSLYGEPASNLCTGNGAKNGGGHHQHHYGHEAAAGSSCEAQHSLLAAGGSAAGLYPHNAKTSSSSSSAYGLPAPHQQMGQMKQPPAASCYNSGSSLSSGGGQYNSTYHQQQQQYYHHGQQLPPPPPTPTPVQWSTHHLADLNGGSNGRPAMVGDSYSNNTTTDESCHYEQAAASNTYEVPHHHVAAAAHYHAQQQPQHHQQYERQFPGGHGGHPQQFHHHHANMGGATAAGFYVPYSGTMVGGPSEPVGVPTSSSQHVKPALAGTAFRQPPQGGPSYSGYRPPIDMY